MAKIEPPHTTMHINMGYDCALLLPPDKMSALIDLLRDGWIIQSSYATDTKAVRWEECKDAKVTFGVITEENLAIAKMNTVL